MSPLMLYKYASAVIKPKHLSAGDKVGIIAPSSSTTKSRLTAGVRILKEFDLEPVYSPHLEDSISKIEELIPLTEKQRIQEVMWGIYS